MAKLASQSTCSWNTRLYTSATPLAQASSRNPRAHGTRVCTCLISLLGRFSVAIHVLMEHAFVLHTKLITGPYPSQSTCSWNTRLYYMRQAVSFQQGRNPRAHGTRVCTPFLPLEGRRPVAIHVLMEHAFVPSHRPEQLHSRVAIHVLMEHAFVLRQEPIPMV